MIIQNQTRIAILMATYNGERYIQQQIDSILNQTYKDWTLYIRDDGSNDNTIPIVQHYSESHDNVILVKDNEKNLGPQNNFMKLLETIDSEIYMFADQDDIWKQNKVELSINEYDNTYKSEEPLLVHTDVSIVDSNLNILEESNWKSKHIRPELLKTYNLLAQCCFVQGNTMLFNNAVKKLCYPLPAYYNMHDWWIATRTVKHNGIIKTVYEPTVLYRQHENNVLGFKYGSKNTILYKLRFLRNLIKVNMDTYKSLREDGYGSFLKYMFYKMRLLYLMRL